MLPCIFATILLSLAAAVPEPENRQLLLNTNSCPNAFQLTSNPCQTGQGRVYFAVPGDSGKFVQCDVLGRAYVVQCPVGLVFNMATTSCQAPQPVTQAPTMAPTMAPTPCTAQAIQSGRIYFPYPGDNTKFTECTGVGQVQILSCPIGLVWDSIRVACVYAAGTVVNPTVIPTSQPFMNPCKPQQLAGNHFYFAHPDPTKFIQCDTAGEAFVVACPGGMVWNQYYEVCASAYGQSQNVVG